MTGPAGRPALGALGGPETFGGQAARALVAGQPELGEVRYLESSAELFADDGIWRVDASCVPAHTSRAGIHLSTHHRLATRVDLHVIAEVQHLYRCALLVRPGTALEDIREVLGHTGSINQSRPWLAEHLPQATVRVVDSHSMGAARSVLSSSGEVAAVGSRALAEQMELDCLAHDIDGGSVGLYWALAPTPCLSPTPRRLVISGRTTELGLLDGVVGGMRAAGYSLAGLFCEPVGDRLFHNDVVGFFAGNGTLDAVQSVLAAAQAFRLAGAYETGRTTPFGSTPGGHT